MLQTAQATLNPKRCGFTMDDINRLLRQYGTAFRLRGLKDPRIPHTFDECWRGANMLKLSDYLKVRQAWCRLNVMLLLMIKTNNLPQERQHLYVLRCSSSNSSRSTGSHTY